MTDDELADDDKDLEPLAQLGPSSIGKLDRDLKMSVLLDYAEIATDDPMERLRQLESFLSENVCPSTSIRCDWSILWPSGSQEEARDTAVRLERALKIEALIPV